MDATGHDADDDRCGRLANPAGEATALSRCLSQINNGRHGARCCILNQARCIARVNMVGLIACESVIPSWTYHPIQGSVKVKKFRVKLGVSIRKMITSKSQDLTAISPDRSIRSRMKHQLSTMGNSQWPWALDFSF
jgi:hypothetical protein